MKVHYVMPERVHEDTDTSVASSRLLAACMDDFGET